MELVAHRFVLLALSLALIILCMSVPFTNIEAEISSYPAEARDAAFLEQALRLQLVGSISIACTLLELLELFLGVSLLLRSWHTVSGVCHAFQVFILTSYIIGGWGVWVFETACILFSFLPAIVTVVVLLVLFWKDVGTCINRCLL